MHHKEIDMKLTVLEYELSETVAIITMNHPPVNALGVEFLEDFNSVLNHLQYKPARAMLIRSACPGFFSAGDDIVSLQEIDDELINTLPRAHALLNALEELPLPTVAALNGHALGGGLELALTCDFRFMGDAAGRIGLPEVRLGMIPSLGGTQRLPLIVGRARAIEMMYKGLQLTPAAAKEAGLITDIFPQDQLDERSLDYAKRLARQATAALGRIKTCINTGIREGFSAGLAMEYDMFKDNIRSRDAKEGIAAFLNNRKPEFRG